MKNALTFAFLCFSLIAFAQSSTQLANNTVETHPSVVHTVLNTAPPTFADYVNQAIRQIQRHIVTHLSYPESYEQLGVEGFLVLEVSLNRRGEISACKIAKTTLPTVFGHQVTEMMQSFPGLNTPHNFYGGAPSILVPIRYSLR